MLLILEIYSLQILNIVKDYLIKELNKIITCVNKELTVKILGIGKGFGKTILFGEI
jgi:hypothetical protein